VFDPYVFPGYLKEGWQWVAVGRMFVSGTAVMPKSRFGKADLRLVSLPRLAARYEEIGVSNKFTAKKSRKPYATRL